MKQKTDSYTIRYVGNGGKDSSRSAQKQPAQKSRKSTRKQTSPPQQPPQTGRAKQPKQRRHPIRRAKRRIAVLELLIGALFIGYYVLLHRRQEELDFMLLWAVTGGVLALKGLLSLLLCKTRKRMLRFSSSVFNILFSVLLAGASVFYLCVGISILLPAPPGCECVMVLGAAVIYDKPSAMLRDRIDTAYQYLKDNPNADVICTGGKSDEDILSESECIKERLISLGIDEERIFCETESSTTVENVRFSLPYLKNYRTVAVVSSGYHVFRGKLTVSRLSDAKAYGVPSSSVSFLTAHYTMREYVAFLVDLVQGGYKKP